MRDVRIAVIAVLAVVWLGACKDSGQPAPPPKKTPQKAIELSSLILPEDKLPEGCTIGKIPDAPDFPVKVPSIPHVSSDRDFVQSYVGFLNKALSELDAGFEGGFTTADDVKEALLAVYDEKGDDLGVFAFKFVSEDAATTAAARLHEAVAGQDDVEFQIKAEGDVVVLLWNEDATTPCFQTFVDFVDSAMK